MNNQNQTAALLRGIAGAVVGGLVGYWLFFWIVKQGFYGLVLPPAMLGLAAGACAGRKSHLLAVICAVAGFGLALFAEWRFEPFIADPSLAYFLTHLPALRPVTWIMLGLGIFFSYRLALGFDRRGAV
jgi:hypothetical protein